MVHAAGVSGRAVALQAHAAPPIFTDGIGAPKPQPQKFSKLVFLINSVDIAFRRNWFSGALVGVGGSDFIGYI